MKTAISKEGKTITANQEAPGTATCPFCGKPVTLRQRRSMSGDVTFFWRHRSGYSSSCRGRFSPFRSTNRNGWSSKGDS